ncbi:MAG: ATP-dependent DNA helicase UvrD2 [Kineosporiaceae bacterium]
MTPPPVTALGARAPAGAAPAAVLRMLDTDLDGEQRRAALITTGPVCILAGAGTGKTRTVTYRVAHAVASGATAVEHVLAVTFTARAAGELRERLTGLGVGAVTARTFHAAAIRQLRHFWPAVVGGSPPPVVEHKAPVVAEAAARVGAGTDRATIRDLAAEIEWAKVTLLTPETYPEAARQAARGEVAGLAPEVMSRVLDAYEDARTARGVVDFEDVLLLTTAMLERHDGVARQVRSRYRWFTVDEYQDVSAAQERLLQAWVGGRRDVCVVGDPNQTIYTFAGAHPDLLTGFPRRHPGATLVHLTRNYRSTAGVVAVGNRLLGDPRPALVPVRGPADPVGSGPVPGRAGEVALAEHDDEVAEAESVAAEIAGLLARGVPASDVAVLVRVNAQLDAFEDALAGRSVPYVVRGGERFFARPEVRKAVTLLRGAAKAGGAGGANGAGGATPRLPAEARAVLSSLGWSEEPPGARGSVRQRWESLTALAEHADRVAAEQPGAGLVDLVADLEARAAAQHAPRAGGVTLATLHAAKGLEWSVVFLPGLVDGTVPIAYATTPEQIEEERRLLYVGVTRARDALRLSWASARAPGGRPSRRPSRFLDGLRAGGARGSRPVTPGAGDAPGPRRVPARPPTCRSCGSPLSTASQRTARRCDTCPPRCAPEVLRALENWRTAAARAAAVPAYVVFSDATLEAIAEAVPADVDALSRVPGVGPAKLARYGADVLAAVGAVPRPGTAAAGDAGPG